MPETSTGSLSYPLNWLPPVLIISGWPVEVNT